MSINKGGVCGMVVGTNDMGRSSAKAWAWAGAVCPPCWWRAVRMRESGDRGRSRTFGEEFATFSRGSSKHGALTRSLRFSPICRLAVSGLLDCASRHYWRVASLVRGHPDLVMWRTLLQHGVPTPKLGAHTNICNIGRSVARRAVTSIIIATSRASQARRGWIRDDY